MTAYQKPKRPQTPYTRISWDGTATRTNKEVLAIHTDNLNADGGLFVCKKALKKGEIILLQFHPLINGQSVTLRAWSEFLTITYYTTTWATALASRLTGRLKRSCI